MTSAKKRGITALASTVDDETVRNYLPLVGTIARSIAKRVPPNVQLEDLMAAGTIGLLGCLMRDQNRNDRSYFAYLKIRIKGAILDELRSQDWLPRKARDRERELRREYPGYKSAITSFEDLKAPLERNPAIASTDEGPMEALFKKRSAKRLRREVDKLPEQELKVVHLRYFAELKNNEISELLGVSEARISQIHRNALKRLKPRLRDAA